MWSPLINNDNSSIIYDTVFSCIQGWAMFLPGVYILDDQNYLDRELRNRLSEIPILCIKHASN